MTVIRSSRVSAIQGFLKSMEKWSAHSELSVISWVSAVEGCPLSGAPLYSIQKVLGSNLSWILEFFPWI